MKVRFEDYYFSDGIRWTVLLTIGPLAIYLLFWVGAYVMAGILVLGIVFAFSTKYITIIDTEKRVIKDLFIVLFIQSGKHIRYRSLHSIRIEKQRIRYNANQRARDRVADFFTYTGTLLYDDYKSLELSSKSEYSWFGSEMKRLSEELQIPLEKAN